MNALQQAFPQATVELWTTDQHRVGLKPILRRVWVRKGSRPRGSRHQRYQWLYLYSFVQPATGKTEWLVLPTVTAEIFTIALSHFAASRSEPVPASGSCWCLIELGGIPARNS